MIISGAGGGGGGGGNQPQQYIPRQDAESLFSDSYSQTLHVLGAGKIKGLANGLQSIYFNKTPLQNPDSSFNFENVAVTFRDGAQDQSYIPGFDAVAAGPYPVGVAVTQATPITRTVTDTTANAVRLIITVPRLEQYTDKNDILATSVNYRVAVQYNGGGYTTVVDDVISGRTRQGYQRQIQIAITGAFPVDIRVSRVTPDSNSNNLANQLAWSSYSPITYAKLAYPGFANAGIRLGAEQFSSIPTCSFDVYGLEVKIPSNATVDQTNGRLIYSGVWDGTFGAAQWTTCVPWCLWDLLTQPYGFGDHIDATQLSKWDFFAASQYGAQLVPDGFGGWEPRFAVNMVIDQPADAYKLIQDFCSIMRAMPYLSESAMTIAQDRSADVSFRLNTSNVSPEGFKYSSSRLRKRPTVAVVKYFNNDIQDYDYEPVEDREAIAKYGVIKIETEAVGCTSRGQAARWGKWLLYTEQREGELVGATTGLAIGSIARPGQVMGIADPVRAGSRRGGRIAAATTTAITADSTAGLVAANSPTLSVQLDDGTAETRPVASITGNTFTVSPGFSSAPMPNGIWQFETTAVREQLWRVLGVSETNGVDYEISAMAHDPSKYNFIEYGWALEPRDITDLDIPPAAPENLTGVEVIYEMQGRAAAKIQLSWTSVADAGRYRVQWRLNGGNWQTQTTLAPACEILDSAAGTYEITVLGLRGLVTGKSSSLQFIAYGKTAPPVDVTGLSLVPADSVTAILSWTQAADLDVRLGGQVLIRHSPRLDTPAWGDAIGIATANGGQVQARVPLLEGSYLLRFEDDGGRQSVTTAYVVADLPQPQARLLVKTYAEDQESPPFNGNAIEMLYSPTFDALVLGSGIPWDSIPGLVDSTPVSAAEGIALTDPVAPYGEYEFGSLFDMGGVFDVNLQRRFVTRSLNQIDLFDSRPGLFDDSSEMFDGVTSSAVNAALLVRSTLNDPSIAPGWSDWSEMANAIIRGRAFQFKAIATSADPSQNILIDELGVAMELQQRIEQSGTLLTTAAALAVTFAEAFYEPPNIGITGYNLAAGDYWVLDPASITRTGFSITFRNSAAAAVARQFSYTAIGFGREIT